MFAVNVSTQVTCVSFHLASTQTKNKRNRLSILFIMPCFYRKVFAHTKKKNNNNNNRNNNNNIAPLNLYNYENVNSFTYAKSQCFLSVSNKFSYWLWPYVNAGMHSSAFTDNFGARNLCGEISLCCIIFDEKTFWYVNGLVGGFFPFEYEGEHCRKLASQNEKNKEWKIKKAHHQLTHASNEKWAN